MPTTKPISWERNSRKELLYFPEIRTIILPYCQTIVLLKAEANANKIALNTGQKTFKQIAAEQGRDWKEQIDEMAEVLEYAKDKGIGLGGVIFDQTAAELYEDEETPADNPQQTDGNQTGEETGQESEEGDGAEEEGETDDQGTDS